MVRADSNVRARERHASEVTDMRISRRNAYKSPAHPASKCGSYSLGSELTGITEGCCRVMMQFVVIAVICTVTASAALSTPSNPATQRSVLCDDAATCGHEVTRLPSLMLFISMNPFTKLFEL